jgi:hypothetical protein
MHLASTDTLEHQLEDLNVKFVFHQAELCREFKKEVFEWLVVFGCSTSILDTFKFQAMWYSLEMSISGQAFILRIDQQEILTTFFFNLTPKELAEKIILVLKKLIYQL